MNIVTLNRVLLNNTPLNYRRKRILTEKDFYFKTIERTFTFSKSAGGKSIKDGRAYIKAIKGNSVVWNQKVKRLNYVSNGVSSNCEGNVITLNGVCTTTWAPVTQGINVIQNHKYLVVGHVLSNPNGLSFNIGLLNNVPGRAEFNANTIFNWSIGVCSGSRVSGFGVDGFPSETDLTGIQFRAIVCDLTQMFGAEEAAKINTIEDYIARKPFVEDEYAYNEGEVIHCNTESIKSVGDNAWDEEWESGRYEPSTGLPNLDEGIRSKNRIKVLPNEVYWCSAQNDIFAHFYDAEGNLITTVYGGQYNYLPIKNKQFTTPTNAATMTIYVVETTTYNNDIMISLVHSGWKQDTDAGYQPYWQDILPLPIIRKYFPDGMKKAGSAHDEIRYNKVTQKWEYSKGKIKSVDMGTLNWAYANNAGWGTGFYVNLIAQNNNSAPIVLSDCYLGVSSDSLYGANRSADKVIAIEDGRGIRVHDSSYTDAATFKAAMAGVILYYESNDWEWVELDAEDQNFRDYYQVADFGTEQAIADTPSAALLADVGYYFKKSEVKELTLN